MESVDPKPKKEINLETHRFAISPESLIFMKETREMFRVLQENYAEIEAMSFFGSRIIGQEHGDSEKLFTDEQLGSFTIRTFESDLDVILFYDNDRIPVDEFDSEEVTRTDRIHSYMSDFFRQLRKEKNISIHLHSNGIDVSKIATKETLDFYKQKIDEFNMESESEIYGSFDLGTTSPFYRLAARFLLSVGDIYTIRQIILDDFAENKNGEIYWRILMQILREFERSSYDHHIDKNREMPSFQYPETLAEGREYFLKLRKKEVE